MLPRNHPDRVQIVFDDHRVAANAGLILPATLAQHLGLFDMEATNGGTQGHGQGKTYDRYLRR